MPEKASKKWYKSKTVWFNVLTVLLGIGVGVEQLLPVLGTVVSETTMSMALFIVGVVNVGLRSITTGAIHVDSTEG